MGAFNRTIYRAWRVFIAEMDFIEFDLKDQNRENVYDRFTEHIKTSVFKSINGNGNFIESMNPGPRPTLPSNWWEMAIGAGKGKEITPITEEIVKDDVSEDSINYNWEDHPDQKKDSVLKTIVNANKEEVYNALLPVYTALKDSFDKRFKLFSWIFDHAKYTAERDSIKAISGLIQLLTNDSKKEVDNRLKQFRIEESLSLSSEYEKNLKIKVEKDRFKFRNPEKAKALEEEERRLKEEKEKKDRLNDPYYIDPSQQEEEDDYDLDDDLYTENEVSVDKINNENLKEEITVILDDEGKHEVQAPHSEDEDELNKSISSSSSL